MKPKLGEKLNKTAFLTFNSCSKWKKCLNKAGQIDHKKVVKALKIYADRCGV